MFCNLFSLGGARQGSAPVNVSFRAIDADDCPVCGAVYRLKCTCACGKYIHTITDRNGCANFGAVCPGNYELEQIAAPFGFVRNDRIHPVEVQRGGCVKVGGMPLRIFNSINEKVLPEAPEAPEAPEIAAVYTDSLTITGMAEPCCRVEVTFPDGACCCVTAHRNGAWCADVPCGTDLAEGTQVCATILFDCKVRSETACVDVLAR